MIILPLLLLLLLFPSTTASIAWLATSESLLHPHTTTSLPSFDNHPTLSFDSLSNNAIFARPQNAKKTGIPYTVTSHDEVHTNPNLVVCFVVQHGAIVQRSCSKPGTHGKGMLVLDRLGTPTITAVLRLEPKKDKTSSNDDDDDDDDGSTVPGSSLLIAWSRFQITVVDEITGNDLGRIWNNNNSNNKEDTTQQWFEKVVIVSLIPKRKHLLSQMLLHLKNHPGFTSAEMDIVVHPAVDGSTIDLNELVKEGVLHEETKNIILEREKIEKKTKIKKNIEAITMTRGGIGCALSHIQIWQELAKRSNDPKNANLDPRWLILEDDVRISPLLNDAIQKLTISKKYQMIYLNFPDYGRRTRTKTPKSAETEDDFVLEKVLGDNWGTSGYMLSSKGAQYLLQNILFPLEYQIDYYLVKMVEKGWRDSGESGFEAFVVEPGLVREWKSLHVSDIQQ